MLNLTGSGLALLLANSQTNSILVAVDLVSVQGRLELACVKVEPNIFKLGFI